MGLMRKLAIAGVGIGAWRAWQNRRQKRKEAKVTAKRGMKPAP